MPEMLRAADPAALERAAAIIRAGGVVAIPTETFYGLAADAGQPAAAARIFEIKGRPAKMALPLVAAGIEQVIASLGPLDETTAKAAAAFWPGPLSLVVGSGEAVRVPSHDWVRALCEKAGALLTATSANKTGEPPARTAGGVAASIGGLVDLIVDGGTTPGGQPSTIADLRGRDPRLIRDGAIAWSVVLDALKEA
jgi:L-threonylcarbamoyladenylate synthase